MMTKRDLTLGMLFFIFSTPLIAQKKTAEFEDGKKIEYEIVEKNPDNKKKINLSFLFLDGLNASYLRPNRFYINANYGYWKYGAEGILFLHSFERERTRIVPIDEVFSGYNKTTYYVIKPNLTLKTYIGIHVGIRNSDYSKQLISMHEQILKNQEVYLGLAFTRLKYSKVVVNGGFSYRNLFKTMQVMLYADALYFPNRDFAGEGKQMFANVDDYSNSLGYRVYGEFKSNAFMNLDAGLAWKLGIQSGPFNKTSLVVGVGYYLAI